MGESDQKVLLTVSGREGPMSGDRLCERVTLCLWGAIEYFRWEGGNPQEG